MINRAFQPILRASAGDQMLETMPVNLLLLGVVVPAGQHRVILRASSAPEIIGAAIAFVGLIACVTLATRRIRPGALP